MMAPASRASKIGVSQAGDDEDALLGGSARSSEAQSTTDSETSRKPAPRSPAVLFPILFYSACSVTMVLLNKAIAMLPAWKALDLVLLPVALQNLSALVLLIAWESSCRTVLLPTALGRLWPGWSSALRCLPCSVAFVAMILTSFLALSGVSVPFVTVGKNASNVLTALGEWMLLGSKPTRTKTLALAIMLLGALGAAWNDLAFSHWHYFWLAVNCATTSIYVLMMRVLAMGGHGLPSREATIAGNNFASLALLVLAAACKGETRMLFENLPQLLTLDAVLLQVMAGACAFLLNFATLQCVGATSATTYAMVGAANKLPTAVIGYLIWRVPLSVEGTTAISIGLLSTFIYAL